MTTRIARHKVTKQTILGAVYEDDENMTGTCTGGNVTHFPPILKNQSGENNNDGGFFWHSMDGTDKVAVMSNLDDLEKQLKRRQEMISDEAERIMEAQQLTVFNKAMKIEKNVKKMTIRDFNQTYGVDVISTVKNFLNNIIEEQDEKNNHTTANKKRVLTTSNSINVQKTPGGIFAKNKSNIMATPYTVTRTVRKGEMMYSSNGSPVCSNDIETEEGDLLATISKKRKGIKMVPNFDARINVGEGRFVTLSDASTYQHLNKTMKDNAIEQVSELQEQMALLIEKLKSH